MNSKNSLNMLESPEKEFNLIKKAIEEKQKQLVFK